MLFVAGMENPPTNKQTAAGLLDGDEEPWTVELRRCLGWLFFTHPKTNILRKIKIEILGPMLAQLC